MRGVSACLVAQRHIWIFSTAFFLTAAWQGIGSTAEPLPEEIPSRSAGADEILPEIIQAVAQIDDSQERFEFLLVLFSDLHSIPADKQRPLAELFEQDALQIKSEQRLISARGSITAVSPTLALKLARQIKDQRLRDYWLSDLVRTYLSLDAEQARQLLAEIKDPLARAQGLVWLARASRSDFKQVQSALEEAKRLGWSHHLGPPAFIFGEILARFAVDHYREVVAFIQSEFPPQDAVIALCRMASVCRYEHKDVEVAGRLLTVAAELVPTSQNPGAATRTLLNNRFAEQNRQHAFELAEKYCHDAPLPSDLWFTFVGSELETALTNVEEVSDRCNLPKDQVLVATVYRIDWGRNPNQSLKWLEGAQRPLLHDAAISSIARGLNGYAKMDQTNRAPVQEWVDLLATYVPAIADTDQRWAACEAIQRLAEDHSATVPKTINDQRASLLSHPDPRHRQTRWRDHLSQLPLNEQRVQISQQWESRDKYGGEQWPFRRIRSTAALVRDSTLPLAEKLTWFDRLLQAAREITNLRDRASALSGLGFALAQVDPQLSLRVHWEELTIARQLGLKPEGWHDVTDDLGTAFALATADEVFRFTFSHYSGNGDELAKVLWGFARKLPNNDDRDATLEALGNVLIKKQDYPRAAGAASLIANPVRQARLLGAITAAQTHKPQSD